VIVLLRPGLAAHTSQLFVELPNLWGDLQFHSPMIILAMQVLQALLLHMKPHPGETDPSDTRDCSTKNAPESPTKLIRPERLSGSIRNQKIVAENAPEIPARRLSIGERIAGKRFARELTEEQRAQWAACQLKIDTIVKSHPELRLQLPQSALRWFDLEICREYYWKCQCLRFEKDADQRIAGLLTSFLQQHPLEWACCEWKNDAIAQLMLGRLNSSLDTAKSRRETAERWLREYWQRERKSERETETYLSPKRMAASAAVFELEMLELADDPQPWMRPGFADYAVLVGWLNKNWERLATKKQGASLLTAVAVEFRRGRTRTALSDRDLVDICLAYRSVESSHPAGAVPTYQVVLAAVARRHEVSPRLVNKMRAEKNRRLRSRGTSKKAQC
jgi:hypothetical protein